MRREISGSPCVWGQRRRVEAIDCVGGGGLLAKVRVIGLIC
jgi:hypothetical protein